MLRLGSGGNSHSWRNKAAPFGIPFELLDIVLLGEELVPFGALGGGNNVGALDLG